MVFCTGSTSSVQAVNLNHKQIPGLHRTSKFNFQDFPELNSFSRTFQVLEIIKKSRTLQDFALVTCSGTGTFRAQDLSFPRTNSPYGELSSGDFSFPET